MECGYRGFGQSANFRSVRNYTGIETIPICKMGRISTLQISEFYSFDYIFIRGKIQNAVQDHSK